jgi:hypothetical protein
MPPLAQGDVYFRKVDMLPAGVIAAAAKNGVIIVTHSETGHHHTISVDVIDSVPNARMYTHDNPLMAWLEVNRPSKVEHQRSFDTHAPIELMPGLYEVRRQREYTPAGFRPVVD